MALPLLSHKKEVRIWDAGCATGEEPYTLAMLLASNMGPFLFGNLDILATDHEESNFPQFENHIKNARYSRKDIFWVPDVFRNAYFLETDDPESFCLTQEIRDKVRYIKHDLFSYVSPESHKALIVCKNVLMHFNPEQQVRVLEMFHESLDINGFLVLDGAQRFPEEALRLFKRIRPSLPIYQKKGT